MPFTFNGIGTRLYGARDFGPDGSYITTEWIVLLYVPIIPVKSMRILPTGGGFNVVVFRSTSYKFAKVPLNGKQVACVYGLAAGIVALFAIAANFDFWWLAIPAVALFFLPWLLRKRAIAALRARYQARQVPPTPAANLEAESPL